VTAARLTARWPDEARPEVSPVYSRREVEVAAPVATVFAWLTHAERWPEWYSQCGSVKILGGPAPVLGTGSHFRWSVLGVAVETTVEECDPPHRLAWRGTGLGATAYHSWDIEPTPTGCRVITEETQRGAVPSLLRVVLRPLLSFTQERWLADLAKVASTRDLPSDTPRA
jgi:uncharacterized protein YndB with AHSA1/START domain